MALQRASSSPRLRGELFGARGERTLVLLQAAWPWAVGDELARRTEVVALDAGTLRVRVPDAGWRKVLHRMRGDILRRLYDVAGEFAPRRMGFMEGPLASTSTPGRLEAAPRAMPANAARDGLSGPPPGRRSHRRSRPAPAFPRERRALPRSRFEDMKEPVILSAVRLPTGKFLGALKGFTAPQLGALVVREAVARAGVSPDQVDEVILGNVVSAGLGQAPARQAAIRAGLPPQVAALTINKVCGSGLKAVMLAAQAVQTDNAEIVVAGGMESMSNCPYLLTRVREGMRLGHGEAIDSMIWDGLWDAYEDYHMGCTGEVVAEKYAVTRAEQDAFALESHRKAVAAIKAGRFKDEILPVALPQKKGEALSFTTDESPREDTSLEALARLKPAFKDGGTVTAGNAPGVNDGAAALVVTSAERARALGLKPLARIVAQAVSGLPPSLVMMTPVEAVKKLWTKTGWSAAERRPRRAQRGFRGPGRGRLPRAGPRPRQGQRERRGRGPRPPHRRERRPHPDHVALRSSRAREVARRRHSLPGRRQRCGAGRRAALGARSTGRPCRVEAPPERPLQ